MPRAAHFGCHYYFYIYDCISIPEKEVLMGFQPSGTIITCSALGNMHLCFIPFAVPLWQRNVSGQFYNQVTFYPTTMRMAPSDDRYATFSFMWLIPLTCHMFTIFSRAPARYLPLTLQQASDKLGSLGDPKFSSSSPSLKYNFSFQLEERRR